MLPLLYEVRCATRFSQRWLLLAFVLSLTTKLGLIKQGWEEGRLPNDGQHHLA